MKQAIGELNGTLVVVIAIAALAAIFFTIIWPMLRDDMKDTAKCADAVCDVGVLENGMVYCQSPNYDGKNGNKEKYTIECPYKG